jgi:hypothetical protein
MGGGGDGRGLTALPNLGNSLVLVKETVAPDVLPTSDGLTALLSVKETVAPDFSQPQVVCQQFSSRGILLYYLKGLLQDIFSSLSWFDSTPQLQVFSCLVKGTIA